MTPPMRVIGRRYHGRRRDPEACWYQNTRFIPSVLLVFGPRFLGGSTKVDLSLMRYRRAILVLWQELKMARIRTTTWRRRWSTSQDFPLTARTFELTKFVANDRDGVLQLRRYLSVLLRANEELRRRHPPTLRTDVGGPSATRQRARSDSKRRRRLVRERPVGDGED